MRDAIQYVVWTLLAVAGVFALTEGIQSGKIELVSAATLTATTNAPQKATFKKSKVTAAVERYRNYHATAESHPEYARAELQGFKQIWSNLNYSEQTVTFQLLYQKNFLAQNASLALFAESLE